MLKLEVVLVPVTDVDRALAFYEQKLGFALDVDYRPSSQFRVVQLTPPGSACSIQLVRHGSSPHPLGLYLVTDDIVATRDALIGRGVDVTELRHKVPVDSWEGAFDAGIDPQRRDYATFADLCDPDGHRWTLQERGYHA
jgi:catechol 2,3-dioxygenase-like lactoylglutathione lyase family enzyme